MLSESVMAKRRAIGIAQTILSGICFGFLGLFGKWLYAKGVVPGELLALRFVFAALIGLTYLACAQRHLFRLDRRQWLSVMTLGVCGYALFSFCFFTALGGLSASLTVLLLYTYPVLVALGGWVIFGEAIPRQHFLAFPFAAFGLVALVWGDLTIEKASYLSYGIAAAIFYALYILASSRWLKSVDPRASTPLIQSFAGITLASLYLRDFDRTLFIIRENVLVIALIAIVCSIMAMGLFLAGLQKLKSWEVSILSTTEPLTGVLVAMIALGEVLSLRQALGALAILFALVWVSRPIK